MSTQFCEQCCEQAAGYPVQVDYKQAMIDQLLQAASFLLKVLFLLGQFLAFACFFSVAIWFAPISRPLTQKEKEAAEARARKKAEEEENERKAAAAEKANSAAGSLNSMKVSFASGSAAQLEDAYHADRYNDVSGGVSRGVEDPESAYGKQMQIVFRAESLRLEEAGKECERQLISEKLRRIKNEISALDLEIDKWPPDHHERERLERERSYVKDDERHLENRRIDLGR